MERGRGERKGREGGEEERERVYVCVWRRETSKYIEGSKRRRKRERKSYKCIDREREREREKEGS